MNKLLLFGILLTALIFVFTPQPTLAWGIGDPIVPQNCGNAGQNACGITEFFVMLANIYSFIVLEIATPLAIIALIVGGIFILISAGRPDLMSKGKTIVYSALIGLALVFGSYLIINFVLETIGFTGNWSNPLQ